LFSSLFLLFSLQNSMEFRRAPLAPGRSVPNNTPSSHILHFKLYKSKIDLYLIISNIC
jgi:hypothetical protein